MALDSLMAACIFICFITIEVGVLCVHKCCECTHEENKRFCCVRRRGSPWQWFGCDLLCGTNHICILACAFQKRDSEKIVVHSWNWNLSSGQHAKPNTSSHGAFPVRQFMAAEPTIPFKFTNVIATPPLLKLIGQMASHLKFCS